MMPESFMDLAGVWIAALLSLCVFSFLFKDNILFKLTEAIFVGVSVGYGIVLAWNAGLHPKVVVPFMEFVRNYHEKGLVDKCWALYMLISLGIGVLYLSRFSHRQAWLSRFPMAYLMGIGIGMGMPLTIQSFIFEQMRATLIPIVVKADGAVNWEASLGNVALLVGVFSVLYYFFFSVKKSDPVSKTVSRVGIAYLMLGFGASFALTVMARISLLSARVQFLKDNWIEGTLRYFNLL